MGKEFEVTEKLSDECRDEAIAFGKRMVSKGLPVPVAAGVCVGAAAEMLAEEAFKDGRDRVKLGRSIGKICEALKTLADGIFERKIAESMGGKPLTGPG